MRKHLLGAAAVAAIGLTIAGNAGATQYTMIDLGALPGGIDSTAKGINNLGQVVGSSDTTGSILGHAFLYSGGAMQDLGTLGGDGSGASSINNHTTQTTDDHRATFKQ